ncbi:MAG TPA: metallophosphoesterase [Thermoanaerobaculia bacterium]|nr:metallophosphoesterase [Thermoanaerobaculia bacterium]
MPKLVLASVVLAIVTACASTDEPFENRGCQYAEGVETRPAAAMVRLALVGDAGADAETDGPPVKMERLRAALERVGRLDGIILLGDNFYPCGLENEDDWKIMEPLARLGVPIFPVLGNHDYGDRHSGCSSPTDPCSQVGPNPTDDAIRALWRFPALNYGVAWEGIGTVAFVDTQPIARGGVPPAEAARFIATTFDTAPNPWRIVAGHHVYYSSGVHGSTAESGALSRLRQILEPARQEGATLFVSGHDHHLELIRRGESMFVISGAASKVRRGGVARARGSLFRAVAYGFVILELTRDEAVLQTFDMEGRAIYGPVVMKR